MKSPKTPDRKFSPIIFPFPLSTVSNGKLCVIFSVFITPTKPRGENAGIVSGILPFPKLCESFRTRCVSLSSLTNWPASSQQTHCLKPSVAKGPFDTLAPMSTRGRMVAGRIQVSIACFTKHSVLASTWPRQRDFERQRRFVVGHHRCAITDKAAFVKRQAGSVNLRASVLPSRPPVS